LAIKYSSTAAAKPKSQLVCWIRRAWSVWIRYRNLKAQKSIPFHHLDAWRTPMRQSRIVRQRNSPLCCVELA
jgi:hypothetical protein